MALSGGGFGALFSGAGLPDTAAVRIARKAFTTRATVAPWIGVKPPSPYADPMDAARQVAVMRSIIDPANTLEAKGSDDVETSFITFRALDRLKKLADAAAQRGISNLERTQLQKAFTKGLHDVQAFLANAPGKLLSIGFGETSSRVKGAPALPSQDISRVEGKAVVSASTAAVPGLTGNEVFTVNLDSAGHHDVVTVDLSSLGTTTPSLRDVAQAFNTAIAGAASGYAYGVKFDVAYVGGDDFTGKAGKYALTMNSSYGATVSVQQSNAADAVMVVNGSHSDDGPGAAAITRFTNVSGDLSRQALGSIAATDRIATKAAQDRTTAARAKVNEARDHRADDADAALPTVFAPLQAQASVTAADGFSYVVGTTKGDMGAYRSKGNEDLFLSKVDSEGNIVWQHALSVAGEAQGAAIALAANGDIVVSGTVSGPFGSSRGENSDMLVARFDSSGDKVFADTIPLMGDDKGTAVAVADDGSIFVGGRVSGDGGSAAAIYHLDARGHYLADRRIDSAGLDTVRALKVDSTGKLLVLTNESGTSRLRQIDPADLSQDVANVTIGDADARAIAIAADGSVAVAGATSVTLPNAAALDSGHGSDGFVTTFKSDLSNAKTIYIGAAGEDQVDSVTYLNGKIFVGGRTTSDLDGTRRGKVDGFIARIDPTSGSVESTSQFGTYLSTTEPIIVTNAVGGDSALGAIGLHRGALNGTIATSLEAQFGLAEGDSFMIQLDDHVAHRVTIDAGETMISLRMKLRRYLDYDAVMLSAPVDENGLTELTFSVQAGHTLKLMAGPKQTDALSKLGIDPVRLHQDAPRKKSDPRVKPGGSFLLMLNTTLNLTTAAEAKTAASKIDDAISITKTAYRSLYWDKLKATMVNGNNGGGATAYQRAQLANWQAALARLTGGSDSSSLY